MARPSGPTSRWRQFYVMPLCPQPRVMEHATALGWVCHKWPHVSSNQTLPFWVLSRLPTPTLSQPGTTGGSLIGGGVRQEVQADLESHTHQPSESSGPDEASGWQEEEACSHLPGWTAHVWLSTKDIPIRGGTRKLAPRYVGPFTVTRVISPTAVRRRLPHTMRRVHPTFHVSRLKPAVTHASVFCTL